VPALHMPARLDCRGATRETEATITTMDYHPFDHVPTWRRFLAAWLVCVALAVAGFGIPVLHHQARALLQQRHGWSVALWPSPPRRA
jgi:hypothetical protein